MLIISGYQHICFSVTSTSLNSDVPAAGLGHVLEERLPRGAREPHVVGVDFAPCHLEIVLEGGDTGVGSSTCFALEG